MSHGRSRRRKPRLGQNFLVNDGVAQGILRALGDVRERSVVEIGPGKGALTWGLLDSMERSAWDRRFGHAVVMVQLEVAERLAAKPGSDAYGSLGALAACTHDVKPLMKVSPGSFRPQPKVWSQVVKLTRLASPLVTPDERQHA